MNDKKSEGIWLEVSNVRLERKKVEVQVKGDKADREPDWWEVNLVSAGFGEEAKKNADGKIEPEEPDPIAAYKAITDGLDKKKVVLASLGIYQKEEDEEKPTLMCMSIRVQQAESSIR